MRRSWSRIFALTMGIPLLLAILAACGAGTSNTGSSTPTTGSTTIKIASDLPVGANDLVPTLRPTGKVTYFRIATTDSHQGPAGADYLYKTKNYKSVYVIDDAETYGVGIADSFTKEWTALGGTVLGRSSEPGTTTSY